MYTPKNPNLVFEVTKNIHNVVEWHFQLICSSYTIYTRLYAYKIELLLVYFDAGHAEFYTKLNVWGSRGLNFDYDGGPIIENGGPIFSYKRRILEGSTSFRKGIRTGLSCQTGVAKHQVIFVSQPFVATSHLAS